MSAKQKADETVRERVRTLVRRQWNQPISVVYCRGSSFEYRVPGRQQNGDPDSRSGFSRFMSIVFGGVAVVLAMPFIVAFSLVDDVLTGDGASIQWWGKGKVKLRGAVDSPAVAVADAARSAGNGLWIAWSEESAAVLTTDADGISPRFLWKGTVGAAPKLDATGVSLAWPDGSAITFAVTNHEYRRAGNQGGDI